MNKTNVDFEHLVTTLNNNSNSNQTKNNNKKKSHLITNLFESVVEQNKILEHEIEEIKKDIDLIKNKFKDEFDKNITFNILFKSINQMLNEYNVQTELFNTFIKVHDDLYNEENIVKSLDVIKNVLVERKSILNNIVSNIIKIQRLANDRIKIDMSENQDEDIDELLAGDSLDV